MTDNPFFDHPILNSPYEYPKCHWELDQVESRGVCKSRSC
jgi:hypothetical protein